MAIPAAPTTRTHWPTLIDAARSYTANIPWADRAASTPLMDYRRAQLSNRGYAMKFWAGALACMNWRTLTDLEANNNPADVGGRQSMLPKPTKALTIFSVLVEENCPTGLPFVGMPDGVVVVIDEREMGAFYSHGDVDPKLAFVMHV